VSKDGTKLEFPICRPIKWIGRSEAEYMWPKKDALYYDERGLFVFGESSIEYIPDRLNSPFKRIKPMLP